MSSSSTVLSFCGIERNNQQVTNNLRLKDLKLVPCNAATSLGVLFQWQRYKAVLRTVKFSTALVNSLCFDLNFALHGFTNHAFVLN